MKKLIAVLLSVALAAGSAGAVPVLAAETAVQESAEGAEKEPMEAQEAEEQTEAGSPVAEDDIRGEGTADITPAEDPADDASVLDAETGEAETGADGDVYSDQENDDPEADLAADTAATSETAAQEEPAEAATGELAEATSEEAAAELQIQRKQWLGNGRKIQRISHQRHDPFIGQWLYSQEHWSGSICKQFYDPVCHTAFECDVYWRKLLCDRCFSGLYQS